MKRKSICVGFFCLMCFFNLRCSNNVYSGPPPDWVLEQLEQEEMYKTLSISKFNQKLQNDELYYFQSAKWGDYYFDTLEWGEKGQTYGSYYHRINPPSGIIIGNLYIDNKNIGSEAAWVVVENALKIIVEEYDYDVSVIIDAYSLENRVVINNIAYEIEDNNKFYYNGKWVGIDNLSVKHSISKAKKGGPVCSGYYIESIEKGVPGEYKRYSPF